MNGACVAALQFATEAAGVLGETADPKWQELSHKLLIPYVRRTYRLCSAPWLFKESPEEDSCLRLAAGRLLFTFAFSKPCKQLQATTFAHGQ